MQVVASGAYQGSKAVLLAQDASEPGVDLRVVQSVAVEPDTDYLLSGYLRTVDVMADEVGGIGANFFEDTGDFNRTASFGGEREWTYVSRRFNSGSRTVIAIGARLGFFGSLATGQAWFDQVSLAEILEGQSP